MAGQRPIFDPARMAAQEDPTLVPRSLTVSQLNALVKRTLSAGLPANIHLTGQISNLTRHGSGHVYFTLKDDRGEIRATMWRSAAVTVKFQLKDGLEVVATGSVDVYEPRGQYQFNVRKLEPKGVGSLELAFRQLYAKLSAEGLFDASHKRPIPRFPRRIGVVTSPTGAAIHDIVNTLRRRFGCVEVLLYPVRVQGEGAAAEIAAAIHTINAQAAELGGIDVLIVGRGGGSLEDLWAFNEEIVARAIHASLIPVISGVGHEVDTTIADLVADLRAPTPTAAAELAVPVRREALDTVGDLQQRLTRCLQHQLEVGHSRLDGLTRAEFIRNPLGLVRQAEQRVDESAGCLTHAVSQIAAHARHRLNELQVRMASVRPAVLVRDRQAAITSLDHRLSVAVRQCWLRAERQVDTANRRLTNASPGHRIAVQTERVRGRASSLTREMAHQLRLLRATVESLANRLEATSYRRTLQRGFTVTWDEPRREIIAKPEQAAPGQIIVTETADGDFRSRVEKSA